MDAQVTEDFHGMSMASFINVMEDKLHRAAQRDVVKAQSNALKKEIRRNIRAANMQYSRRNISETRIGKKYRGKQPLIKTIKDKTWNVRNRGILGKVAGASYPEGAQSHLAERGFQHHASGRMTVQHWFQRDAEETVRPQCHRIAVNGFKKWLRKQQAKGKPVL